jgi:hypothetical protein
LRELGGLKEVGLVELEELDKRRFGGSLFIGGLWFF